MLKTGNQKYIEFISFIINLEKTYLHDHITKYIFPEKTQFLRVRGDNNLSTLGETSLEKASHQLYQGFMSNNVPTLNNRH